MIAAILDQVKTQPWYYTLGATLVLYYLFNKIRLIVLARLHHAKFPDHKQDWFFGFPTLMELLSQRNLGLAPEYNRKRMVEVGKSTFSTMLGGRNLLITKEPENIKAILGTQFNDFVLGVRHTCTKITLGDGIFTLDGPGWKHSRAMLRPQFAREQVGHVQSLEPRVQALFQHIKAAKGGSLDIQPLFFKLTLDSGTDFLFGESCHSLSEDQEDSVLSGTDIDPVLRRQFPDAFNYAQNMLNFRLMIQNFYWLGTSKEFRRSNKIVHDFTNFYVNKALSATDEEFDRFSRGGYVFLYELAKQTRDPIVLRDQCLNILLAARDTTAGLLSFVFFELARNPEVFKKLRDAIEVSFGVGEDVDLSLITFEALKKCEYLKWVLHEALRMYPSVPQNFRVTTKNTTLPRGGGHDGQSPTFVPKGTSVIYNIYSTHRDEDYYGKDAHVFRPERWGEPSTAKLGWAFLPFNGGPRICLGQQFALTEAGYVTVRLLQQFKNIQSFDEEYPPKLSTHLTLSLFDGAHVGFT